jgi:hypothetical protein
MADSSAPGATWVNITNSLFSASITRVLFNDPAQALSTLKNLKAIQADWRFAIPDDFANPSGPKHPVLYVGGEGGVFRSLDKGVTWTYFPNIATDGAIQEGGLLPSTDIRDLDFALGNINPLNGTPDQPFGRNMLVATTYGRGTFGIRLNDQIKLSNGQPLYTYAVSPVAGPHVASIAPAQGANLTITGVTVTFSGPVDPVTFTTADILSITGPDGQPIAVSQVQDVTGANPHNIYRITFATPQSKYGFYQVSFGPNISDYSGDRMDQNQNVINGETPGDIYSGRVLFQPWQNHAPVLADTAPTFPPVLEDETALTIPGSLINTFITGMTPPGITDADNGPNAGPPPNPGYAPLTAPVGIAVTGVDNTNGFWQYSTDNGTTWINFTNVSPTAAVLLEGNSGGVISSNKIRFLPNNHFSGTASFTFRAWDLTSGLDIITGADGLIADASVGGGTTAFSSAEGTATITVLFVNDAPTFTKGPNQSVLEDAGPQTVPNWAKNVSPDEGLPPAANEAGQTLDFIITTNNDALFSVLPAVSPTGTLTYTTAPNANGIAIVTVRLHDNGGTANGGIDTSPPQTFTITVGPVNDAPIFIPGATPTVLEDSGPQTLATWGIVAAGPPDEVAAGQNVTIDISNDNTALFTDQPALALDGTLTFTPAPNANGTATVTVILSDDGGTDNGGIEVADPVTFTIVITPVNDAPSFIKGASQTVNEDAGPRSVAGWATAMLAYPASPAPPAPDEAGQALSFIVTTNNDALFSVLPAVSPAGTLTFTTAPNANGVATVTVVLKDDGGTANGGADTSSPPQTFTITVRPVNDVPSFTKGADQTVLEDAGAQTVTGWATNILPYPAPPAPPAPDEAGQTPTFLDSNNNPALFSVQPAVAANGTLTYTPAPNANGTATVTVRLTDNGGTANGGINSSATQTFSINVTAVNDAPSFTKGPDQTVNEDAGPQSVASWATNLSVGPINEFAQTLSFQVTNDNNALFAVQPTIDATGKLTYTSAPNANGSATVTVIAKDTGDTANGGANASAPQTFVITVRSVNDVPSFTAGPNQTILEGAGPQTVPNWATNMLPYPPAPALPAADEAGQTLDFQVSNDNNALFTVQPTIASSGTLTYTAAPDANGVATVTVRIHDNGGTANGGVDTSAAQTFTITITPINDVPSFTKGPDQAVLEDAGLQTVAGWATGISAGAPNESAQALDFQVSNDNNALFAVQPTIDPSGTLTYRAAPNANGSATVTVRLHDNAGTANGGADTSAEQTFVINVAPVNDAPSFTKGPNQTVLQGAGPQTVAGWATGILPYAGPPAVPAADEATQALDFIMSNDNNGLFSAQPALDPAGTLTFTAAPGAQGRATVSVRLHDDGGTANGGVDTSAVQTFFIDIASATTTTLSLPANSTFGLSVTLTAQVTRGAGAVVPLTGGIVEFREGTTVLGTGTLDAGGTATFSTAALPAGPHDIKAVYLGDSNYTGSESAPGHIVVDKATTAATLTPSHYPVLFGTPVTQSTFGRAIALCVRILPAGGTTAPLAGGLVTFKDGATAIGTGVLDANGVATYVTAILGVGTHNLTAVYAGDANFIGSASTTHTLSVGKATTATTVTSAVNPAALGDAVTLSIKVTPTFGSTLPLAGQVVTILDGTRVLGTRTLTSAGTTAYATRGLAVGPHNITVVFGGDSRYIGSQTPVLVQTVRVGTTTTVTAAKSGQTVTITAQVTPLSGGPDGLAGQRVIFWEENTALGYGTLDSSGIATFTTSTLGAGTHSLRASYVGGPTFLASLATPVSVTLLRPATVSLNISPNPGAAGDAVTFTSFVTGPGATPTGTLTFTIGTIHVTVNVINGKAIFATRGLGEGTYNVSARYNGDALFDPGISLTLVLKVSGGRRI